MEEPEFQDKLLSSLKEKLSDDFSAKSQFSPNSDEADLEVVYDMGIFNKGSLSMLVELKTSDNLHQAKKQLRKFYGPEGGDSDVLMAVASPKRVVVFDFDGEITSENLSKTNIEEISDTIVDSIS